MEKDLKKEKRRARRRELYRLSKKNSPEKYASRLEQMRKYIKSHPEKNVQYSRKWRSSIKDGKPWGRTFLTIEARVGLARSGNKKYRAYRGIKNKLTINDLEKLWFRCKAWKLKQPSIDRINPRGHYILSNCRYIEHSENSRKLNS